MRSNRLSLLLRQLPGLLIVTALFALAGCGAGAFNQATVPATPTVTMTVAPTSSAQGNAYVITVVATNATQVTVSGSDGSQHTFAATGGTWTVTPTASTTYTATANGAAGTVAATAVVTVVPAAAPPPPAAPTVTITATPASMVMGSSAVLNVVATNATQVTVTGTDNSTYTLQTTGGMQTVTPVATTTYTATAVGTGGKATATTTVTVTAAPPPPPPSAPTVTITASPTSIEPTASSTLTVTATNATAVTVTGSDGTSYTLQTTGGTQVVTPTATTTYTATAAGAAGTTSATAVATITVLPPGSIKQIQHVVFLLQENHSFDNYFGMLNPYRQGLGWNVGADGKTYDVDGIDDKLTQPVTSNPDDEGTAFQAFKFASTCIDDETSAWLESWGDVNRYDFASTRTISMNGFVHTAEGFDKFCSGSGNCSGQFTDPTGERSMGYYDQGTLNYYYYMASQFALSDRWFSPVASKSIDNRIATTTGGTTQGLAYDPSHDDNLTNQLAIPTIFGKLTAANVSWKIYYTADEANCLAPNTTCGSSPTAGSPYPAMNFTQFQESYRYIQENPGGGACPAGLQSSTAVGDSTGSFCIDTTHIAPISQYNIDLTNNALPSFAFIEAGFGNNDEHPGSGQSILLGQTQVASLVNALMVSPEWTSSVFFLAYDEGGGPFDHVPPVPGSSNLNTDATYDSQPFASTIPDIGSIAVQPDGYLPCLPPTTTPQTYTYHCDLRASDPGANPTDPAAVQGFGAQIGFRVPNMVISPFTRKHYVSHIPMDHTAIIRFVEDRFIGDGNYLTKRDAAQPTLLDFFDFNAVPWATPPTPPQPNPVGNTCNAASYHP